MTNLLGEVSSLFAGMRLIIKPDLTTRQLYPRSPARAKRRAKRGYLQHYREVPNQNVLIDKINRVIYCHPMVYAEIRQQLNNRMIMTTNNHMGFTGSDTLSSQF